MGALHVTGDDVRHTVPRDGHAQSRRRVSDAVRVPRRRAHRTWPRGCGASSAGAWALVFVDPSRRLVQVFSRQEHDGLEPHGASERRCQADGGP